MDHTLCDIRCWEIWSVKTCRTLLNLPEVRQGNKITRHELIHPQWCKDIYEGWPPPLANSQGILPIGITSKITWAEGRLQKRSYEATIHIIGPTFKITILKKNLMVLIKLKWTGWDYGHHLKLPAWRLCLSHPDPWLRFLTVLKTWNYLEKVMTSN